MPESENVEDLELVCAEMTTFCSVKVLFCSIYRPHPDNHTDFWLEEFNIFLDHASETYMRQYGNRRRSELVQNLLELIRKTRMAQKRWRSSKFLMIIFKHN